MNCFSCGKEIDSERLEALPHTQYCTKCSHEQKQIGFMVYDHKTAPRFITIGADDTERLRIAKRANRRSR